MGLPTRNWPGSFVESNRESQQADLVFPDGGAIFESNSAQKPFDTSGPPVRLEDAASAASPASNGTTKSTAGDPMAKGGDDAARLVAGRRSDGGGQRSPPVERHGSEMWRCQSQKSDEKWSHCGNDDDLTNGARTCIFKPDGVFGIHRAGLPCRGLHQGSPEPVFPTRREIMLL